MPKVHSGRLQTRITIRAAVRTPDGRGGFTNTWTNVGSMWAEKTFESGGEIDEANQLVSRRRYNYTGRRRKDLTIVSAMQVVEETQVRAITSVVEDDTDRSAVRIICEEAP